MNRLSNEILLQVLNLDWANNAMRHLGDNVRMRDLIMHCRYWYLKTKTDLEYIRHRMLTNPKSLPVLRIHRSFEVTQLCAALVGLRVDVLSIYGADFIFAPYIYHEKIVLLGYICGSTTSFMTWLYMEPYPIYFTKNHTFHYNKDFFDMIKGKTCDNYVVHSGQYIVITQSQSSWRCLQWAQSNAEAITNGYSSEDSEVFWFGASGASPTISKISNDSDD